MDARQPQPPDGLTALRSVDWAKWAGGSPRVPSFNHWPGQDDLLHWCQAAAPGMGIVLILVGLVYLLFGWSVAKALVTLNAAVIGAVGGAVLGEHVVGGGAVVPVAVVSGLLAATAAWPTFHASVAVLGGLLGAVLGVTVWRLANLDPAFGWSGGLTGLVLCGLLSLLLFRPCVITYTSLQGATMLVFGGLALLLKHDDLGPTLAGQMDAKPLLLPMAVFVPALAGYIYQQAMSATPAAEVAGPPPPPKK